MSARHTSPTVHGLMAEFEDPNALVAATYRAHYEGYRQMDAYSPFPIEELHEALGAHHTRLPLIVLIGGIARLHRRLPPAVLGDGDRVPAEHRRQAASTAGRCSSRSRSSARSSARRCSAVFGMLALNGLPHAVPPGVQRAALRAGQPQPLLPVHRGRGSEVRPRADARASSKRSVPRRSRPLRTEASTRDTQNATKASALRL